MPQEQPKRRLGWVVAIIAIVAAVVAVLLLNPCPPGKPVPAVLPAPEPAAPVAAQPQDQERQADPEIVSHGSTSR